MHAKRIFDVVIVLLLLPWVLPLVLLLGILVACSSPGGAWYAQIRMGRGKKTFRVYKLRTMIRGADTMGPMLTCADDPRITPIGAWLRATKLDELPQLLHVLMGEMSLVGPRPEVPLYADCFSGDANAIFTVRPGLTDSASLAYYREAELLAQSADPEELYRNTILPAKVRLSLIDIANSSLRHDAFILWKTVRVCLGWRQRGNDAACALFSSRDQ